MGNSQFVTKIIKISLYVLCIALLQRQPGAGLLMLLMPYAAAGALETSESVSVADVFSFAIHNCAYSFGNRTNYCFYYFLYCSVTCMFSTVSVTFNRFPAVAKPFIKLTYDY
jgi:hypothetical protein